MHNTSDPSDKTESQSCTISGPHSIEDATDDKYGDNVGENYEGHRDSGPRLSRAAHPKQDELSRANQLLATRATFLSRESDV
jgi:hypothetical protein